jgi:uncharacterized protein (TIGR00299 family) protein
VEEKEQGQRNLEAICKIIQQSSLSRSVKEKCVRIFEALASAEGAIHNKPVEEIHFHEVGAVDSIVDIVGAVYGLEHLGIKSLFVSPLPLGSGFVQTTHGRIPIPAPATVALLEGMPVYDSGIQEEMVTPTGASLMKVLATSFGAMPPMVIEKAGYGAGKRNLLDRPNLLRILLGDPQTQERVDTVVVLESNIDDMSPEWMGYLMDCLFNAGALDVVFCPVHMKKNRPGVQIQVVGRPDQRDELVQILFNETSTLGIRFGFSQRKVLQRTAEEVDSPWGKIKVKKIIKGDGSTLFQPEYEACRNVATNINRPLREVFYWVMGLNKKK